MNILTPIFKRLFFLFFLLSQSPLLAEVKVTYYIPDASGSPVAATDEQGKVKWRKQYSPHGKELEQNAASKNNHIGYTGHVHDKSTGLTYMRARYYDPNVGRFMSMDPAAVNPNDPNSFNRFAYANNNPYKYVDPDGRNPERGLIGMKGFGVGPEHGPIGIGGGASGGQLNFSKSFKNLFSGNKSFAESKGVGSATKSQTIKESIVIRKTKSGDKAMRVTRSDGSVTDISPMRVKEFIPNTHPNAPPGTLQKVRFENPLPGSKGFKRSPTQQELKRLSDAK